MYTASVLFGMFAGLTTALATQSWTAISPGGDTRCARGGEFTYFVRQGSVNKLVIYFEGGGSCWNTGTCGLGTCTEEISEKGEANSLQQNGDGGGLLSSDSRSPTKDWHAVFVPYCTCDGHSGNKTADYGLVGTFHHVGRVNAEAAIQMAFKMFPNPSVTLTTGESAGSVGSYIWAPFVMQHYKHAKNYHVGDSYAPLFGKDGWEDGIENWDMPGALATFVPGLERSKVSKWTPFVAAYIVQQSAHYFSSSTFASYTSNGDIAQTGFYVAEGGGAGSFTDAMRNALQYLHNSTSNFASFIAPGIEHSQSNTETFYTTESNGNKLHEWYSFLVEGSDNFDYQVDCYPSC